MNKQYRGWMYMEEVMARSRYAHHTVPGRKRKRVVRENGGLPRVIARQLLIALILLLAAGITKSVNTPVTNFISEKVQLVLQQNIELKSIYDYMDKAVVNLKNSIAPSSNDALQAREDDSAAETGAKEATDSIDNIAAADKPSIGDITSEPETSVLSANYVSEPQTVTDMLTPVSGILSSPWGERTDPLTGKLKFHEGIDIEANKGASIKAVLDGTVEEAGSSPSYGNYVKLGHDGGLETVYAHCSILNVKMGEAVKQGEVVAKAGDTGASVGVHLHFEVLKDGQPMNPLNYISLDVL